MTTFNNRQGKLKVYLCARVSKDAHEINNRVSELLSPHFDVFVPHQKEAELKHPKVPMEIYQLDVDAMLAAAICVTIAPYGKDCSWEMGHFAGQGKPIFMYVPNLESVPTAEWMISGGTSVIVTDNLDVFEHCQSQFSWLVLYTPMTGLGLTINNYVQHGGR